MSFHQQGGAMVAPIDGMRMLMEQRGQSDHMANSDKEGERGAMRLAGCSALSPAPNNKQTLAMRSGITCCWAPKEPLYHCQG